MVRLCSAQSPESPRGGREWRLTDAVPQFPLLPVSGHHGYNSHDGDRVRAGLAEEGTSWGTSAQVGGPYWGAGCQLTPPKMFSAWLKR